MHDDNPLIKAEEGVEALALLIARYYRTLIAEGIPDELAQELTEQFQEMHLQQAAGRQAMASFCAWLERQNQSY